VIIVLTVSDMFRSIYSEQKLDIISTKSTTRDLLRAGKKSEQISWREANADRAILADMGLEETRPET